MRTFEIADSLRAEIQTVRAIMSALACNDASLWLGMAAAGGSCHSIQAREWLQRAGVVARNCGFPVVSEWIARDVLNQMPGTSVSSTERSGSSGGAGTEQAASGRRQRLGTIRRWLKFPARLHSRDYRYSKLAPLWTAHHANFGNGSIFAACGAAKGDLVPTLA